MGPFRLLVDEYIHAALVETQRCAQAHRLTSFTLSGTDVTQPNGPWSYDLHVLMKLGHLQDA